jgi:Na+/H+-dicarboxylate symporter
MSAFIRKHKLPLIDRPPDRFRTAVNAWGDCVGAAVVDSRL